MVWGNQVYCAYVDTSFMPVFKIMFSTDLGLSPLPPKSLRVRAHA